MEDTVEKVAEWLTQLEKTVAEGFFANGEHFKRIDTRFNAIELRLESLDDKIDISVESLRGDLKTVIGIMTGHIEEMRRTTEAMRKEHAADREVLKLALKDHTIRVQSPEEWRDRRV